MELVQELLMTVAIAILFSFFVAKLVSMATTGDIDSETVTEEIKFDGGLRVEGTESETRVKCVGQTLEVDEFEGESESVRVQQNLPILCRDEELVVKRCEELGEIYDAVPREEVGVGVELPENSSEKRSGEEVGVESATDDGVVGGSEEVRVVECGENEVNGSEGDEEEKEGLIGDEDGWEGIERTELDERFAAAVNFVGCGKNDDVVSDVHMQLYGLHKIALEGPCHEPQPMALKVSARAKWNVWQRLGNMNPEVAMEQYIALLSDRVPGWMEGNSAVRLLLGDGKPDSSEAGICGTPDANLSTSLHNQPTSINERRPELKRSTEGVDLTGSSNSMNRDKE